MSATRSLIQQAALLSGELAEVRTAFDKRSAEVAADVRGDLERTLKQNREALMRILKWAHAPHDETRLMRLCELCKERVTPGATTKLDHEFAQVAAKLERFIGSTLNIPEEPASVSNAELIQEGVEFVRGSLRGVCKAIHYVPTTRLRDAF